MLDIKLIRESPEKVRKNLARRGNTDYPNMVDAVISYDKQWREKDQELNSKRAKRNELAVQISKLKKDGEDASDIIAQTKQLGEDITRLEGEVETLRIGIDNNMARLPNLIHPDVPDGKDESENVERKKVGTPREFDFPVKNHVELIDDLGLADFDSSAKTSGAGFYFLKGDLALLNQALISFSIEHMLEKGFEYIEPPLMLFKDVLTAALDMEGFEQSIYKVDEDDLCLIGTSEYSLLGMHTNEVIQEHLLPKKYFAYSMCFRKEIGSHGINERGLWRTHQFNKVEQFVFCMPEDSDKFYDQMLEISEEIYQKLGLPYRVVECCTGDLAMWKWRSADIELWRPTTQDYGEVCSLSNCTDYQARNLGIRTIKPDGTRVVLHTLNNTVVATSRIMVAILENFQNADGTVTVPGALRPWMGDAERLG